ncbi:MAG: nuclear transport factor 2 family protein [Acidimicrobiales bacterium]
MDLVELEQRLTRIEDVEAIKRLKALYYDICDDDHNPDRVVELFAEHGSWEGGGFAASGREDIHKLFTTFQGLVGETLHAGVNPIIAVDGDHATGVWYTMAAFKFQDGGQQQLMAGRYDDTYVKVNGEWKLEHLRTQLRVSIDLAQGTSPLPDWARPSANA